MSVRFFKDNFNARFVWGWGDDGFVSSDSAQIEHFKALGLRFEEVEEVEETEETAAVKRGRKKK